MDLVMVFVLGAETLHDGDRIFDGRLFDEDLLETSLEGVVLFDELGIFI